MDVGRTSGPSVRVSRAGGPARIDPTEWRGLAVGAPAGLVAGGALGALISGNGAMRHGLQGTRAMDRALVSGGAIGALAGVALGIGVGFMVGHVQDEGWTIPGS
jgi:hypothetical protein